VPAGEKWIHEIKFDGYRMQLHKEQNDIRAYTRRGYGWTERVETLVSALWRLQVYDIVLGEVIVPTETGHSDFGALESDLGSGRSDRLIYFAFDVLHIHGYDLRRCKLGDRKHVLLELLRGEDGPIRYSEHLPYGGPALFENACKLGLEGIMSKRLDSPYRSQRTNTWTKITCRKRETFVVAGIAYKGKKFDGIYLGRRKGRALEYAGKVEHGFSAANTKTLEKAAQPLVSRAQPLTKKIRKPKARWLKPKLLADVEYRALTGEGKLRHPSFKGLRSDL
jgi:bifunctional non-homologous end joining protein LigD